MIIEDYPPFKEQIGYLAPDLDIKPAVESWEINGYFRLRREIFCEEEGIFENEDRDENDLKSYPIVAVTKIASMPDQVVGVVRIFEEKPGIWWGGRLGISRSYRRTRSIGPGLIKRAVTWAHAMGCESFYATVMERNSKLFKRLHWSTIDVVELYGLPHHVMQADLIYYPPEIPGSAVNKLLKEAS